MTRIQVSAAKEPWTAATTSTRSSPSSKPSSSKPRRPAPPAPRPRTTTSSLDVLDGPAEQRDAPRLSPEEVAREVRVTVRGAAEAKAINVSETGVLAETTSRLRPGTVVELILTFDGVRRMLRATIVRSMVHSLNPTTFRTAFKFEERTTLPERR
jgi:hypothetical protein